MACGEPADDAWSLRPCRVCHGFSASFVLAMPVSNTGVSQREWVWDVREFVLCHGFRGTNPGQSSVGSVRSRV